MQKASGKQQSKVALAFPLDHFVCERALERGCRVCHGDWAEKNPSGGGGSSNASPGCSPEELGGTEHRVSTGD